MLQRIRIALVTAAAAMAGLALAAQPAVIRIGVASPTVGTAFTAGSAGIAYTRGWIDDEFRQDGIKVEWHFFKGAGPAVNEALTNKQLDFALQGDFPSTVGHSVGLKTRIIAMAGVRTNLYLAVPTGSPVKTVADLKGRKVGLFVGTNLQLPANRILADHGLAERDLKIVNLDLAGIDAALSSNDLDAGFSDQRVLKLRDQGKVRIVYTTRGHAPRYTRQNALLVTDHFARRYPDATTRVVRGLVKAARWVADDKNANEAYALWARMGVPEAVIREDYSGESLQSQFSPLLDDFAVARYREVADGLLQLRLIRKPVAVPTWFDRRFLDAALRQTGLAGYWQPIDADGRRLAGAAAPQRTRL
ncbi:ABC transporter substrate-binding protein [Chitiniphilus purpureus]|uniref:ABC transporter substrate-binding protein n=1 Tax=Chitiniphilus purpureus TaxID=2981137 RepID=A0ABY6DP98_9NEIS|nr:ABC transporter substrate-binding protein [Chitiniphilus sp. CD1]UXY16053.1 ABC transporter substrate-binding protein [Chitiniphilus sp. CD1]